MIKNRNGPLTARARSDPSSLIGARGDPTLIISTRGDPPVKKNIRDGPQERVTLSLSKEGLIYSTIPNQYRLNGRGMPGWKCGVIDRNSQRAKLLTASKLKLNLKNKQ